MKDNKKTILQVVGGMNLAGVETVLMNLLRKIDRKKYNFIFLCYKDGIYDYEREINNLGARVVRIKDQRIYNPISFINNIEKVIKNERVDIVHSHVDLTSAYAMIAARRAGVDKRIVHAHSTSATKTKNIFKNISYPLLKNILNTFSTEKVSCGMDAGRFMFGFNEFKLMKNGVDPNEFKYSKSSRKETRNSLGIAMESTVLLHVGRFEKAKNHFGLIDIFRSYLLIDKSAKLILIGHGSQFKKIEAKIEVMGIRDSVYMLGSKTGLSGYFSAADLFIMPSIYEGLPVSLIEAQMSGLPCVISKNIDKSVAYRNVTRVELSEPVENWAKAISATLDNSRRVSKRLVNDYSIGSIAKKYEDLYEF